MARRRSSTFNLALDTWRLGAEAWTVIALRTGQAMMGSEGGAAEASLMLSEKAKAAVDAQWLITRSVLSGEAHLAPARTLALYRRRVQANRRRLTTSSKTATKR